MATSYLVALPLAYAQIVSLEPELLRPSEAFVVSGELEQQELTINVAIAEEYYLYRERTSVAVVSGNVELGEFTLPPGKVHTDEFFGEVATYRNNLNLQIPATIKDASDIVIAVTTQGCADLGVCFPPYTARLSFIAGGGSGELLPNTEELPVISAPVDNTSALQQLLASANIWVIVLAFFNAGVLLAFTPCVLPMVPIVLAVTTKGSNPGGAKAFTLGLSYVLGMAVVYTVLGIITARSGALLTATLQTPVLQFMLAIVFLGLGAVILDNNNFRLVPARVATWLANIKQRPGTYKGATLAGMISAIVVSPCVAAPLVGALLFIAGTGDEVTGAVALFALALGMGLLPLACAAGAGSWLPPTGPLSEAIRQLFGYALFAVAIWVLDLDPDKKLICFGAISIAAAISMFAAAKTSITVAAKTVAYALLVLLNLGGTVLLVGGLTGSKNELAPLAHLFATETVGFETVVTNEEDYLAAYAQLHPHGTFEYFTADWCISCREIEAKVFANEQVVAKLTDYRRIKIDLSANDPATTRLLAMHDLFGPPAMILRNGNRRQLLKIVGNVSPAQLVAALEAATTN